MEAEIRMSFAHQSDQKVNKIENGVDFPTENLGREGTAPRRPSTVIRCRPVHISRAKEENDVFLFCCFLVSARALDSRLPLSPASGALIGGADSHRFFQVS